MITFTEQAQQKVREFQQADPGSAGKAFRIAVDSGGCSGFQYDFTFDEKKSGDSEFTFGAITVLIDAQSLPLLGDATVDFIEDFQGAGFSVTNPNATSSCGCGKSFGV